MEIIVNSELKLVQLNINHANTVFNIVDSQRDYLGKWLPFVEFTKTVDDTKNWIKSTLEVPNEKKLYNFAIIKNEVLVGLIALNLSDTRINKTEIGYWISADYQGQGLATFATEALCKYAFTNLNFNKIVIKCGTGNFASLKIPLKLGFRMDGIERDAEYVNGEYYDVAVYTMLQREYLKD